MTGPTPHPHPRPAPDPAILDEIVRRIVAVAHPERIILFGSAARGEASPDSDLDLLVIKSGVPHRRRLAQQIHVGLFGIGVPVDIIVVTPEDVETFCNKPGSIIEPAIREGTEIYVADPGSDRSA
jgi:predicted nucleotidyltransferase